MTLGARIMRRGWPLDTFLGRPDSRRSPCSPATAARLPLRIPSA